jgi:hypothetical protein
MGRGAEDPSRPFLYRYDVGPWVLLLKAEPCDETGQFVVTTISALGGSAPLTPEGVGVGAALADVTRAYGEEDRERTEGGVILHYPSLHTLFPVVEGEVEALVVYRAPPCLPVFIRRRVRRNTRVALDPGLDAPAMVEDVEATPHPLFPSSVAVRLHVPPPPSLVEKHGAGFRLRVPEEWKRQDRADETCWTQGVEQVAVRCRRGREAIRELAALEARRANLLPPQQRILPGAAVRGLGGQGEACAAVWQEPLSEELGLRHYVLWLPGEEDLYELEVVRRVHGSGASPDGEALARGVFLSFRLGDVPERSLSENGRRRIYRILCNLAACDGEVDANERRLLDAFREEHGLSPAEAQALEAEGRLGKDLPIGKNPAERELLLDAMIDVAAADGVLAPQEERRLRKIGKKMGIGKEELRDAVRGRFSTRLPSGAREVGHNVRAGATVILLDLDPFSALHFDEISTMIADLPADFVGFSHVPAGVHYVAHGAADDLRPPGRWLTVQDGAVVVLEVRGGRLRRPSGDRSQRQERKLKRGDLAARLIPYPQEFNPQWPQLTAPLSGHGLPSLNGNEAQDEGRSRLEVVWRGTHGGDGAAMLREVAYAFLAGRVEKREEGVERWFHLLQAIYHCGERLPQEDPSTFVGLSRLLCAQWRALPESMLDERSPVVYGSNFFVEDLIDTEVAELVAAGRAFGEVRHERLAESGDQLEEDGEPGVLAARMQCLLEDAAGIEALDPEDERLIGIYFQVSTLAEVSGMFEFAGHATRRQLQVGQARGVSPADLAGGYARLARLLRAHGDEQGACDAERRALRHGS